MEQLDDPFIQKKFELLVEMATKKLHAEISSLKEQVALLSNDVGSVKSQVSRLQFQPQPVQTHVLRNEEAPVLREVDQPTVQVKKEVKIVDCRPDDEKHEPFESGAAKNAESVRPRYGDYQSKDVSIDKFFYFGRK